MTDKQQTNSGSKNTTVLVDYPIYGGSLTVSQYVTNSLRRMGVNAKVVDNTLINSMFQEVMLIKNEQNKAFLSKSLVDFLSDFYWIKYIIEKPDIAFFNAQSPINIKLLQSIKKNNTPIVFWFVEDYRRFPYYKEIAPLTDLFLTIQKDLFFRELDSLGKEVNYSYLPMAADPEVHKKINLTDNELKDFGSEISFMGAAYPNRQKLFAHLLDFNIKLWGSGWEVNPIFKDYVQKEGERISVTDSVKIYNASIINLNLHSSLNNEFFEEYPDFINPRTFEIMACGGFQLVDKRKLLPEFFTEGEDLVTFDSLKDLRDKINYFLRNDNERNQIAANGQKKVLEQHTYYNRISKIFDLLQVSLPNQGINVLNLKSVQSTSNEILTKIKKKHPDLNTFLSENNLHKTESIKEMIEYVKSIKGLDQVKSTVLFLEECLSE